MSCMQHAATATALTVACRPQHRQLDLCAARVRTCRKKQPIEQKQKTAVANLQVLFDRLAAASQSRCLLRENLKAPNATVAEVEATATATAVGADAEEAATAAATTTITTTTTTTSLSRTAATLHLNAFN
ncbi:uncharacterized protein LOC132795004 [Drosophila nasuta]|uniref:uncharacterized protein LOC132795004 n=1 Tax=Drosophila nasuta TaxID=42062 RepID=UPI00295ED3BF|nr:uncharacterized protein LOC132795004 [Drosophila nasuta]